MYIVTVMMPMPLIKQEIFYYIATIPITKKNKKLNLQHQFSNLYNKNYYTCQIWLFAQ